MKKKTLKEEQIPEETLAKERFETLIFPSLKEDGTLLLSKPAKKDVLNYIDELKDEALDWENEFRREEANSWNTQMGLERKVKELENSLLLEKEGKFPRKLQDDFEIKRQQGYYTYPSTMSKGGYTYCTALGSACMEAKMRETGDEIIAKLKAENKKLDELCLKLLNGKITPAKAIKERLRISKIKIKL